MIGLLVWIIILEILLLLYNPFVKRFYNKVCTLKIKYKKEKWKSAKVYIRLFDRTINI